MSKKQKKSKSEIQKLYLAQDKLDKKVQRLQGVHCVDCDVNTVYIKESYMVIDSVWKESGMTSQGGRLCVGCIERRLGRKLQCSDFFVIGCNINAYIYPFMASKRLRERLHSYNRKPTKKQIKQWKKETKARKK